MITGLAATTIFSQDHSRLVPFYRDTLGLPVQVHDEGETIFGPEGGALLVISSHDAIRGKAKEPQRQIPVLRSTDTRADHARLAAQGVQFIGEPEEAGPFVVATLQDPDGNLVNIMQFE
jgi:catechol 2,3-dioxygenase-like lactoylglutathione lyase family enzyme